MEIEFIIEAFEQALKKNGSDKYVTLSDIIKIMKSAQSKTIEVKTSICRNNNIEPDYEQ